MQSIWEAETFYKDQDILIIGAGFTGLWTALAIKEQKPEKEILVLEKSVIPTGASSRNAGFACFGSYSEILADAEKMGWDATLKLVEQRYLGLQKIQQYFSAQEIDFDLCGGYEILQNPEILSSLKTVNKRLSTITNISETYTLAQEKIKTFGLGETQNLLCNPLEGSLHSGKLLMKLLQRCQVNGIAFLFGTEVLQLQESAAKVTAQLQSGVSINAKQAVICTNAFSDYFLKEDIIPARGQILLTQPIKDLQLHGTFHYDEGFYYFRNLGNRVLLGGGRNQDFITEKTTVLETTTFLQNHLEDFLRTVVIPKQEFQIEMRWSGIMAMGKEKSPIVKRVSDRQFCAVRLSGMGVALAPILGSQITQLL